MITIAVYNLKGGVGKTAAAVNLAAIAASEGENTLLWDLDPQGSTSFYYRVKPKFKGGAKTLVGKGSEILAAVKETEYENLDLIPADLSIRNMDFHLDEGKNSKKKLAEKLPIGSWQIIETQKPDYTSGLVQLYGNRTLLLPTEGIVSNTTPTNITNFSQIEFDTTTSMLNTPYFINSILY